MPRYSRRLNLPTSISVRDFRKSTNTTTRQAKKTVTLWYTTKVFPLWETQRAGLASDFRLRSAFDVISLVPLSSQVSFPLSAWNFARVFFKSIHSANTVGERSNFLTLALHLLCVDGSSRPFQSTRFRYSCIRNWLVRRKEPLLIGHKALRLSAHHLPL